MGVIRYDDVLYGGGGDNSIILSQAQYNALTPAEKADTSKIYYIYDAVSTTAEIDDTTTASDKVWSSLKTSTAIAQASGASIDDTTTAVDKTWSSSKISTELLTKVDNETGKGLSTNDYTTADKNKLNGIASGAEVNVQSDWEQTDDTADDFIKNKPTIPPGVTVDQTYNASSTNAQSGTAVAGALNTLGTASTKDVPTSGNASTTQVVMGNDTRLSDSRPASDVSAWAKAANKPSYTASEVGGIPTTEKGSNNGVATLGSDGKVPSSQLPSYVDDVLEYANRSAFPATGESGKIYIAQDTNKSYRWSGTAYVEISSSLALGETSSTAYAGNKGKANADNIATIQGLIPSSATTSNKLATASDIPSLTNYVQKSSTSGLLKNDGSVDTSSYTDAIELTQAQYDALSSAQKHDTTKTYYITDGGGSEGYTLPTASNNTLGGIKVGNRLTIDSNGYLSADENPYSLPIASANTLGGVKVGSNFAISNDGTINPNKATIKWLASAVVNGGGSFPIYGTPESTSESLYFMANSNASISDWDVFKNTYDNVMVFLRYKTSSVDTTWKYCVLATVPTTFLIHGTVSMGNQDPLVDIKGENDLYPVIGYNTLSMGSNAMDIYGSVRIGYFSGNPSLNFRGFTKKSSGFYSNYLMEVHMIAC